MACVCVWHALTLSHRTGQHLISGMGELHLEIVLDRLRREHRVDVELDRMRVAYRESISSETSVSVRLTCIARGKERCGSFFTLFDLCVCVRV